MGQSAFLSSFYDMILYKLYLTHKEGFMNITPTTESYLHAIADALVNKYQHKQVEPPTETDAYASGDVIFVPIEIPTLTGYGAQSLILDTVLLTDDDELNRAIDLVFLRTNVSIGAVNAAASLPSASSRDLLGTIKILAADYVDQGDFSAVEKTDLGRIFSPPDGESSIWVAGIARAAATYTSTSGLGLSLGFRRN